jgi:hypothetical protein
MGGCPEQFQHGRGSTTAVRGAGRHSSSGGRQQRHRSPQHSTIAGRQRFVRDSTHGASSASQRTTASAEQGERIRCRRDSGGAGTRSRREYRRIRALPTAGVDPTTARCQNARLVRYVFSAAAWENTERTRWRGTGPATAVGHPATENTPSEAKTTERTRYLVVRSRHPTVVSHRQKSQLSARRRRRSQAKGEWMALVPGRNSQRQSAARIARSAYRMVEGCDERRTGADRSAVDFQEYAHVLRHSAASQERIRREHGRTRGDTWQIAAVFDGSDA